MSEKMERLILSRSIHLNVRNRDSFCISLCILRLVRGGNTSIHTYIYIYIKNHNGIQLCVLIITFLPYCMKLE